jgi:hypothetical protein
MTVALLESRQDAARSTRRRVVQKVARMMPLAAGELTVGHEERAVRLATLAAKATLELSDTSCSMTGHGVRAPSHRTETAGEL